MFSFRASPVKLVGPVKEQLITCCFTPLKSTSAFVTPQHNANEMDTKEEETA